MNRHLPTPMIPAMLQQQQRYRTQQAALNLPPQAAGVHVAQEGAKIAALFDIYDNRAKRPEKAPAKAIPNVSAARRQPGAGTKFHQPETCRAKEHPTWGGSGDTASPIEASAIVQRQPLIRVPQRAQGIPFQAQGVPRPVQVQQAPGLPGPPQHQQPANVQRQPLIQAAPQLPQHAQGVPVQAQGVPRASQHQQPVQGFPGAQGLPGQPQRRAPLPRIQAAPQLPQHPQGMPVQAQGVRGPSQHQQPPTSVPAQQGFPVQHPQVYQSHPPFPHPVNNGVQQLPLMQGPPMHVPPPGVYQEATLVATIRRTGHTQQPLTSQRFQMQPQQRKVYGLPPPPQAQAQPQQQGFAGYAGAPRQFGVQQRVRQDAGLLKSDAHFTKETIDRPDVTKLTKEWMRPCPRVEEQPAKTPEVGVTRHGKENNRFNPLK